MDSKKEMILQIIDMNDNGQGVAKQHEMVYFVDGAVLGDVVNAEVVLSKKNYAVAKVLDFVTKSPLRKNNLADYDYHEIGMSLYPLRYDEEIKLKENKVLNDLKKARIESSPVVNALVHAAEIERYRNKGVFPISGQQYDLKIGVYKRNAHIVKEYDDYPLMPVGFKVVIETIKEFFNSIGIKPYDEQSDKGVLRHLVIRENLENGYMIGLVARKEFQFEIASLVEKLSQNGIKVVSLSLNINDKRGNAIIGRQTTLLYGSDYIEDYIGYKKYRLQLESFFQVNKFATVKLYEVVKSMAQGKKGKVLWDLYCGAGTIGIYLADYFDKIMGVEIVKPAIINARQNAEINGVTDFYFEAGKAEVVTKKWCEKYGRPDLVVLDPPRKGVDKTLLDTLADLAVADIIYVSCKPSTLMRDVKILEGHGYEAVEITPCDLFPGTMHVECVVLLSRK